MTVVTLATSPVIGTPGAYDPNQQAAGAESVKQLGRVDAILELHGVVYVGGNFSTVSDGNGTTWTRSYLYAYNKTTNLAIRTWVPSVGSRVRQLKASPDGTEIWIAHGAGLKVVPALTSPSDTSAGANAYANFPSVTGGLRTVYVGTNFAYIGGTLTAVAGTARDRVAKLTKSGSTWSLASTTFTVGTGGTVYKLGAKTDGSLVAMTGDFPGAFKIFNGTTGALNYNLAFAQSGAQHGIDLDCDDNRVAISGDFGPNEARAFTWTGTELWNHQCDGNVQAIEIGQVGSTPVLFCGHHGSVAATAKSSASPTTSAPGFFSVPWTDAGGDRTSYGTPPNFAVQGDSTPLKVWAIHQGTESYDLHVGGDFEGVNGEGALLNSVSGNNGHRRYARFAATTDGTPPPPPAFAPLVVPAYDATPRFVLANTGERILLRGLNIIQTAADADRRAMMVTMGVNCVRVVLNWHLLATTAPTGSGTNFSNYVHSLDTAAMAQLDADLQFYADNDIYFQIDSHQAGWSPFFGGSGIPSWYYTDARFKTQQNSGAGWTVGAQSTAIRDFWTGTAEKVMSQALYIGFMSALVSHVLAQEYSDHMIGYQLFNEPNPGSMTGTSAQKISNMHTWLAPVLDAVHALDPYRAKFVMCRGGGQGYGTATFAEFGNFANKKGVVEYHNYYTGLSPGINASGAGAGYSSPGDDYYPDSATVHNTTIGSSYHGAEQYQEAFLSVPIAKAASLGVPLFFGEFGVHFDDTGRLNYIAHAQQAIDNLGLSGTAWKLGRTPNDDLGMLSSVGGLLDVGVAWQTWFNNTNFISTQVSGSALGTSATSGHATGSSPITHPATSDWLYNQNFTGCMMGMAPQANRIPQDEADVGRRFWITDMIASQGPFNPTGKNEAGVQVEEAVDWSLWYGYIIDGDGTASPVGGVDVGHPVDQLFHILGMRTGDATWPSGGFTDMDNWVYGDNSYVDTCVTAWADIMKTVPRYQLTRMWHEMGQPGNPYFIPSAQSKAPYVNNWIKIVTRLRQLGALGDPSGPNQGAMGIVWCPAGGFNNTTPIRTDYFPGAAYTDWIGCDAYDTATGGFDPPTNLNAAFYDYYVQFGKPMMLCETGIDMTDPDRLLRFQQTADTVRNCPNIKAIVYWDGAGNDLVDTPAGAFAKFNEVFDVPYFMPDGIPASTTTVNGTTSGSTATSGAATGVATHHAYSGTAAGDTATSGSATGSPVHHVYSGTGVSTSATSGNATGKITRLGAGTIAGGGTLSATGRRTRLGAVDMAGAGTLVASGVGQGAARITGTGTVTAAGVPTYRGSHANLAGSGSLAVTSTHVGVQFFGATAVSGHATLSATGNRGPNAVVHVNGTGTLQVAGVVTHNITGAASISGTAEVSARWQVDFDDNFANLVGHTGMSATGLIRFEIYDVGRVVGAGRVRSEDVYVSDAPVT